MGVYVEKAGVKREWFITRYAKKFIGGFMDFADKGFWYIGR
jgi:hypothetical protein